MANNRIHRHVHTIDHLPRDNRTPAWVIVQWVLFIAMIGGAITVIASYLISLLK